MIRSDEITEIVQALIAVQAEIKPAEMNRTNPFLKNKYADLGSIIAIARQPLARHGLCFTQALLGDGTNITIETMLLHKSGQYIGSLIAVPMPSEAKGRSASQEAGAITTYFRRYALASLLGIYADEDSDGDDRNAKKPAKAETTEGQVVEPAPHKMPEPTTAMTLETAEAVTNRDGVRYGDIDSVTLGHMATSIRKALEKNGLAPEQKTDHQYKLDAALTILKARG